VKVSDVSKLKSYEENETRYTRHNYLIDGFICNFGFQKKIDHMTIGLTSRLEISCDHFAFESFIIFLEI